MIPGILCLLFRLSPMFLTHHMEIPATERSVEIEQLTPAMDYVFRIAAKNQFGAGQFSAILAAKTLEAGTEY